MPSKKAPNPRRRTSAARERSKSVGRSSSRSRGRTPTRTRSRSKTPQRKTPASESKIRRRRSPSSSRSSSPSSASTRHTSQQITVSISDQTGDRRAKRNVQEVTPSRVSQRIIQKLESNRPTPSIITDVHPPLPKSMCPFSAKAVNIRWKVCLYSAVALFSLVAMLPFICWLNLMVFAPETSHQLDQHTSWGPCYSFAGALWPVDWRIYLDCNCFLFVLSYFIIHLLIARFIPVGRRIIHHSIRHLDLRYNGWFALMFFSGLYAVAQFGGLDSIPKPTVLLNKYWFGLLASTGIIASLCAFLAYFASAYTPRSQLSSNGNSGHFLIDLCVGRSLRPTWWGVDWKQILLRSGLIALALFDITRLLGQWEHYGRVSPALCSMVSMQLVGVLDYFVFEHTKLFNFDSHNEGFGYYLVVFNLMIPFFYSVGVSYLYLRPDVGLFYSASGLDKMQSCLLAVSILIFLAGYIIYRKSNNQKDLFRRQPNHRSFAEFDKISGPHSQQLLAGGLWGFVRHPNYLGELMMAYAQCIPTGFSSVLIWLYPLFLTCSLIHRISKMEYVNLLKFDIGYTMYKKLVPHRLLPKVY